MVARMSALLVIVFALAGCDSPRTEQTPQAIEDGVLRTIKYGFTLRNTSSEVINDAYVKVYAPLAEDGIQELIEVTATMPFDRTVAKEKLTELHFSFDALQPYRMTDVWITATVRLSKARPGRPGTDVREYLGADRFVEVDDAAIVSKASELQDPHKTDGLKNAFRWIADSVTDEGYTREDKGALYALTESKGDCTEQMYLFMALSRAMGVPSRGVAGFVQPRDGVVRSRDYHNWAEAFVDDAWRVVDPLKEKFMVDEAEYIGMAYVDQGSIEPNDSQSFFQVSEGVEVTFK